MSHQLPRSRRRLLAFIAFASEDTSARDFLVRLSQFRSTPWTFIDHSVREPFDEAVWRRHVYWRIKEADVVIVLIGETTHMAMGALWEVREARRLKKTIFGVLLRRESRILMPSCMLNLEVVPFDLEAIQSQLERAADWVNSQGAFNGGRIRLRRLKGH